MIYSINIYLRHVQIADAAGHFPHQLETGVRGSKAYCGSYTLGGRRHHKEQPERVYHLVMVDCAWSLLTATSLGKQASLFPAASARKCSYLSPKKLKNFAKKLRKKIITKRLKLILSQSYSWKCYARNLPSFKMLLPIRSIFLNSLLA